MKSCFSAVVLRRASSRSSLMLLGIVTSDRNDGNDDDVNNSGHTIKEYRHDGRNPIAKSPARDCGANHEEVDYL